MTTQPNVVEYNKIHALARARKLIMQKFGENMLHFWPITDGGIAVRDLLRRKPLFVSGDVTMQQPGLLYFGVEMVDGYISDVLPSKGRLVSGTNAHDPHTLKTVIPAGLWSKFTMRVHTEYSGSHSIKLWIAPNGDNTMTPDDSWDARIASTEVPACWPVPCNQDVTLVLPGGRIFDDSGSWSLYATYEGNPPQSGIIYDSGSTPMAQHVWDDDDDEWSLQSNNWYSCLLEPPGDLVTWASTPKFTAGMVINADVALPDGTAFAMCNASQDRVRIGLNQGKPEISIVDANNTRHTLTSPLLIHPGHNLITLSYDKGVTGGIKLGVNGKVVDSANAPAFDVLGQELSVSIGAKVLTGGTVSDKFAGLLMDDAFIAEGIVTDADIWNIYMAYITAAPLMQVEDVTGV